VIDALNIGEKGYSLLLMPDGEHGLRNYEPYAPGRKRNFCIGGWLGLMEG